MFMFMEDKVDRIASALSTERKRNSPFCVEGNLKSENIAIKIDDFEQLDLPLTQACASNIYDSITALPLHGAKEIPCEKLQVNINKDALNNMLKTMHDELGLVEIGILKLRQRKMVIYDSKDCFDVNPYQGLDDTGTFGTLVVVLPVPHIGGHLIIHPGEEQEYVVLPVPRINRPKWITQKGAEREYVFSSENIAHSSVRCVMFYSDSRCRITRVIEGNHVALIYDVALAFEENSTAEMCPEVKSSIVDLFKGNGEEQSEKIVYLLDHNYTEDNLRWNMLKGVDKLNASALLAVATELNLSSYLAQMEILESYHAETSDYVNRSHSPIENEMTLSCWVDSGNNKVPFKDLSVSTYGDGLCWTKCTSMLEPYETKFHEERPRSPRRRVKYDYYDDSMDYASKMDYRYKRTALILWPKSTQIKMNFEQNNENALSELRALTESQGNEAEVVEILNVILDDDIFFIGCGIKHNEDFELLGNIALYVKDEKIAVSVFKYLKWNIITPGIAKLLVKLEVQYGVNWCVELLIMFKDNYYSKSALSDIDTFVSNFFEHGGDAKIVEFILDVQTTNLTGYNRETIEIYSQTLVACAAIDNVQFLHKIMKHLVSCSNVYPEVELAELYIKLRDVISSDYFVNFEPIRSYVSGIIEAELALGLREDSDWSIKVELPCNCRFCGTAEEFLCSKSKATQIQDYLTETQCKHVIDKVEGLKMNLPIEFTIIRGIRYAHDLAMVKKDDLHKDAKERFQTLTYYKEKLCEDLL